MANDSGGRWAYLADALVEWFDELSAGGIFMTDAELRIRAWNRWLERHTGLLAPDMVGVPLVEAFPELAERGLDQYYRDALAGEARVVAQRFHGYLLPVSARTSAADRLPAGMMPQSARIAPLRVGSAIVGTITVIENVTERVMSERELRSQIAQLERARATAEAAVRAKDEFLATLSHELRTPLNAVLGWTRLLRSGQVESSRIARALEVIDRNATAQAQLIDDMLDVARIMQGKLRLDMQQVDLVPIVLAAIDVIRPAAQVKRLGLTTRLDLESATATADAGRLQQVIWNLLSNAVKFTDPGGRIDVSLGAAGDRAELRIVDTGKGIAPDFLPYVFDRFRQEDSTTTRSYGGLGLGLALVRQLVELHGGTVRAESAGEGRGSTFVLSLPIAAGSLADTPDIRPAADRSISTVAGRVVLVVDDEVDTRDVIGAALLRHGARVVTAASSAEALEAMACRDPADRPELIVADIGMPGEDGYALMRRIRALAVEQGGGVPAIALTGYAGPDDRARASSSGFQRHLAKPVDPNDLLNAIAALLEPHHDREREMG